MHIKNHKQDDLKFFHMDPKEWYTEGMSEKGYSDPVQEGVRILIDLALVKTFDLIKFKYNNQTKYVPQLPLPHECCIHRVIDYATTKTAKHVYNLSVQIQHLKSISAPVAKMNLDKFQETFRSVCLSIGCNPLYSR